MDDDDVNSHHADDKEMSLRTPPILWFRQDRYFYFRLQSGYQRTSVKLMPNENRNDLISCHGYFP